MIRFHNLIIPIIIPASIIHNSVCSLVSPYFVLCRPVRPSSNNIFYEGFVIFYHYSILYPSFSSSIIYEYLKFVLYSEKGIQTNNSKWKFPLTFFSSFLPTSLLFTKKKQVLLQLYSNKISNGINWLNSSPWFYN